MKKERVQILNIEIDSVKKESILTKDLRGLIFTPNVDHLMKLQSDKSFYNVYRQADWILCDSRILWLLSRFLGTPIKKVITGSDFFPDYCKEVASKKENNKKVFLLGGSTQEILENAINNLNSMGSCNYVVGGYCPKFGFETNEEVVEIIIDRINKSGANVLAVGLGASKQEKLTFKIKNRLQNVNLFFAIGATINFISGDLKRAPLWMQKIAMEWFFRLITDPRRMIKRYVIDDSPILWLIIKQRLGFYNDPFRIKDN